MAISKTSSFIVVNSQNGNFKKWARKAWDYPLLLIFVIFEQSCKIWREQKIKYWYRETIAYVKELKKPGALKSKINSFIFFLERLWSLLWDTYNGYKAEQSINKTCPLK